MECDQPNATGATDLLSLVPEELRMLILGYLDIKNILKLSMCCKSINGAHLWSLVTHISIWKLSSRSQELKALRHHYNYLKNATSLRVKLRRIVSSDLREIQALLRATTNLRVLVLNTRNSYSDATELLPYSNMSCLRTLIVDSLIPLEPHVLSQIPRLSIEYLDIPIEINNITSFSTSFTNLRSLRLNVDVRTEKEVLTLPVLLGSLRPAVPTLERLDISLQYGLHNIVAIISKLENVLEDFESTFAFPPSVIRFNGLSLWQLISRYTDIVLTKDQLSTWHANCFGASTSLAERIGAILSSFPFDPYGEDENKQKVDAFYDFASQELRKELLNPQIQFQILVEPILAWTSLAATAFSLHEEYQVEASFWIDRFKCHFIQGQQTQNSKDRFSELFVPMSLRQIRFMSKCLDDSDFVLQSNIMRSLINAMIRRARKELYDSSALMSISQIVTHKYFNLQAEPKSASSITIDAVIEMLLPFLTSSTSSSNLKFVAPIFEKAISEGHWSDLSNLNPKLIFPNEHLATSFQECLVRYFKNLIYSIDEKNIETRFMRLKNFQQLKQLLDAHCASFPDDSTSATAYLQEKAWIFTLHRYQPILSEQMPRIVDELVALFGNSLPQCLTGLNHASDDDLMQLVERLGLSLPLALQARQILQARCI